MKPDNGDLPPVEALIGQACNSDDQPYKDIAQALGCDEATVRTHFTRGRAWLSQELASLLNSTYPEENP